jgi:hypothetical protein
MNFMTLRNAMIISIATITILSGPTMIMAENNICIETENVCQRKTDCNINETNKPKLIAKNRCERFLEYYDKLNETALKYSTPTLKLTPSLLSAIVDRESHWLYALKPNICEGTGDRGWGHGLVQIDGYYSTPYLGRNGKKNKAISKQTKKYGAERFNWSSCNESLSYLGAYLLSIEESHSTNILKKLKQANLNTDINEDKTFKDKKVEEAYLKLILNSYNAGPYGTFVRNTCSVNSLAVVIDNCTTGKNYATDVLNRSNEFQKFESTSKIVEAFVVK